MGVGVGTGDPIMSVGMSALKLDVFREARIVFKGSGKVSGKLVGRPTGGIGIFVI